MTLGEVIIAIEGYQERERQSLISRISSILRAFQRKGDPFKGLIKHESKPEDGRTSAMALRRLLGTGGKKPKTDDLLAKESKRKKLWK